MPEKPGKEESIKAKNEYQTVLFFGAAYSPVKLLFESHGVVFPEKMQVNGRTLLIADGNIAPSEKELKRLRDLTKQGTDLWLWCPTPVTFEDYNRLLPAKLELDNRKASSFLPKNKSWTRGLRNSDFYFCEIQREDVSDYGLKSDFADEGTVLLEACNTDWRVWNQRPEELKTAAVIRSENEEKGASAVLVKYQDEYASFYVSTLSRIASSTKGYETLEKLLSGAGIPAKGEKISKTLIDSNGMVKIPYLPSRQQGNMRQLYFQVWSPRPLDDLLIEPDMPKLDVRIQPEENSELYINRTKINGSNGIFSAIPLKQGWNRIGINIPNSNRNNLSVRFECANSPEFMQQLKTSILISN
jgi:beta-galactosidase